MATLPRIAMKFSRSLYGSGVPREFFLEKATQTYKLGALVVFNGGYIQEASADPTAIVGVAEQPGQNKSADGDEGASVVCALPGVLFIGNLDDGSAGKASVQTDIGTGLGTAKHSSTGKWYVDSGETSTKSVQVWNFFLQDGGAIGDKLTPVYFAFDPDRCVLLQS